MNEYLERQGDFYHKNINTKVFSNYSHIKLSNPLQIKLTTRLCKCLSKNIYRIIRIIKCATSALCVGLTNTLTQTLSNIRCFIYRQSGSKFCAKIIPYFECCCCAKKCIMRTVKIVCSINGKTRVLGKKPPSFTHKVGMELKIHHVNPQIEFSLNASHIV